MVIVLVPGYTNSGPEHWQSLIEKKYENVVRVKQDDWDNPVRQNWIDGLERTIKTINSDVLLVGHSCGANTIAQWAELNANPKVKGALLVAPADIDAPDALAEIQVQRPLPKKKISFPTILVCSDNDEYVSLEKGKELAQDWGSELVILPNGGHIHTDAGFGDWPMGEQLIEKLCGFSVLTPHQNYKGPS
jgi:uncharacterized protein